MKKLMTACAVAGLSAAVFGDVTSQNIVGYNNLDSNASGSTMMTANFLKVGEKNSCTLADLSVTGYTTTQSLGVFQLKLLKSDGTVDGDIYFWVDWPAQNRKGWFLNSTGTKPIPGGAESVQIPAGRAAWCQGKGLKLVPSGEVNQSLVEFISNASGSTAIGNCTPVGITLDKLTVTGYTTTQSLGVFQLKLLKSDGTVDGDIYFWVDWPAQNRKGWFLNSTGTKVISGGAESIAIPAGRGAWCQGKGLTLKIPAPVL